ncbi:hypothetical protein COTS27_00814 [Spirochaetota bacterium]|nr:hypothetical protein COTS27_00814 [Spirochaetota bacterium]
MKPIKKTPSFLRKTITSCLRKLQEYYEHPYTTTITTTVIIFIFLSLFILLMVSLSWEYCWPPALGKTNGDCEIGTLIVRLGYAIGGVIALFVAMAGAKRARALDETAKAQERGNIEDRYKNAIEQFGKEDPSIRLAGAYGLYHLAKDNKDRRENICDVLCVHIRELTTSEVAVGKNSDGKEIKYSEKYATKPSNEIQSILDLLVNKENKKDFPFKSHWINLASAYLNGANLWKAQLQGANLWNARLQRASLYQAQLQGAHLSLSQFQGAVLGSAQLQGAVLRLAQLQNAEIKYAQFQGANLSYAHLQEADLSSAQFQGADLNLTQLQGANLREAQLQGASLRGAQLQGANLSSAGLQMTNLSSAQFQGADLIKTDFRGAFTEQKYNTDFNIDAAIKKLKDKRNQKDDIQNAIFSGGVRKYELDDFKKTTATTLDELDKIKNYNQVRINHFELKMNKVEKILEDNLSKPEDNSIPSGAITGIYPKAEADKIIAMLEELNKQLIEIEIRQYYWG